MINSGFLDSLSTSTMPNLAGKSIGEIIYTVISTYFFPAAGIILFLYLIFGGYQVMLSGGDPKVVAAGKSKITSAIIGFVIMFAAYWLVEAISYATGLESIGSIFK